jgi:hypothetical protein
MFKLRELMAQAACALVLVVAGCAGGPDTKPVTAELPPAELGVYPAGTKWEGIGEDGQKVTSTLVATDGKVLQFEESSGCKWSENAGVFAPSLSWKDCDGPGTSGTQTIVSTEGNIWPLKIGNTQSWSLTGKDSTGNSWSTTRTCVVKSTEKVTVPAGSFDAYRVECGDKWHTLTFFYSPQLKDNIYYQNVHKKKGLQRKWQYVSGPTLMAAGS